MRSLVNLRERHVNVKEGECIVAHTVDSSGFASYLGFVSESEGEIRIGKLNVKANEYNIAAAFPLFAEDGQQLSIIDLQYLGDSEALCVVLSSGDIILVSDNNGNVEIIGSIEDGIHAAAWSPDCELVVSVTGRNNYVEMTRNFDVLVEKAIETDSKGEDIQVNIGWGKKETQFHGSEGKEAAKRYLSQQASLSLDDDLAPRVSWRGDGSHFCISLVDRETNKRRIRVYNRDGILQSTSETVDKLEHSLSWRPSGNLITSSQRLPHRHDVVFFERNGLRHGEFTLIDPNARIVEMYWNCDSTLLALWLSTPCTINSLVKHVHSVQLWYMSNYYWSIKQEIVLGDIPLTAIGWHAEHPLHLDISTAVTYSAFQFTWDIISSPVTHVVHSAPIAVIDGQHVLYTPLRYANVPPPISLHKLSSSQQQKIKCLAFSGDGPNVEHFATLLGWQGNAVDIWEVTTDANKFGKNKLSKPVIISSFSIPTDMTLRQLHYFDQHTLLALGHDHCTSKDTLIHIKLSDDLSYQQHAITPLPCEAHRLYSNKRYGDVIIEGSDGVVFKALYDEEHNIVDFSLLEQIETLPTVCDWVATSRIGLADSPDFALFSLNNRSRLYLNGTLLSNECTSFHIHSCFLIFTTFTHTARFIPLTLPSSLFKLPEGEVRLDESFRRVERGSKIVLSIPFDTTLILQMPRGNIETIYPRALVLDTVRLLLKQTDYRSAFFLCRKHRIDLNILVDDNMGQFMSNVLIFMDQVRQVDYLNLFLSSLKNENVTETMYQGIIKSTTQQENDPEKVNKICDAIRTQLQSWDVHTYISTIITTYVRKTPPELEQALRDIKILKETSHKLADAAIKYTVFLVKVDVLYDVALGMYDFPLVLMIAQHSQKDPREYLPFLTELKELPLYYRQFKVDDHLQRYERALENLSCAGLDRWDECVQYISKHALYQVAIRIFKRDPERLKAVALMYGDYLLNNGQVKEAAIAYHMAEKHVLAISAYRRAGLWQESFALAEQIVLPEDEMGCLAYDMSRELHDRADYRAAAEVLNDYAHDVEKAMVEWLRGSHWSEATRAAYHHKRPDLIATHVKPGVNRGHKYMLANILELREDFEKRYERLVECRYEKEKSRIDMERLGNDDRLNDIDMMSDATSMMSTFTGMTLMTGSMSIRTGKTGHTNNSSKARRKAEKKRHQGRKGSIYEEEYLVDSCRRIAERVNDMKDDVSRLIQALMQFIYIDEAQKLQNQYTELLLHIRKRIPTVFVPPKQTALEQMAEKYLGQRGEVEESQSSRTSYQWPTMVDTVAWKLPLLQ